MKEQYVCGFLFNLDHSLVYLIKKNRPETMKGKLNGIGGRMQPGETASNAMWRECEEEADVVTEAHEWRYFAKLSFEHAIVHFFAAATDQKPRSMTDEKVIPTQVSTLKHIPHLHHQLLYLIPMALDPRQPFAQIEEQQ